MRLIEANVDMRHVCLAFLSSKHTNCVYAMLFSAPVNGRFVTACLQSEIIMASFSTYTPMPPAGEILILTEDTQRCQTISSLFVRGKMCNSMSGVRVVT